MRSYTPEGQRDTADYIVALAKRWSLGAARIVEFPEGAKFADQKPRPCNVVIDYGNGSGEQVIVHSHFDTVPPTDYPADFSRDPHQLIADQRDSDICYGLGSYDMLGAVAGTLKALHGMRIAKHRRIRALFVWGEEDQSQGTHAALHPADDLLRDATCILSGEIPVGGKLDDDPKLLIGRTGRVGLRLEVHGEQLHSGAVRRRDLKDIAVLRMGKAVEAAVSTMFAEHPHDPLKLMPESLCIPRLPGALDPGSMSVVAAQFQNFDVLYTNPDLSATDIQGIVRDVIARVVPPEVFTLHLERGRQLPFTKPWLEDPNHRFVRRMQDIASAVSGRGVPLAAGRGVADESIMVHAKSIPCVTFPLQGSGEHGRNEGVRISSIDQRYIPFIRQAAAYEGSLTA